MNDGIQKAIKLFNNNNFNEALDFFLKELKNIDDETSCNDRLLVLEYVGQCYRHLKQYNEAINYFKKALEITENENQKQVCELLRHLGSCYSANGNHIESLKCLEQSLRIAREVRDKEYKAELLYGIGTQYIDAGELRIKLKKFDEKSRK
ncbi:MAG: tetratricopeptide repeat protein [Candidatus Helarchaeota archaeon]